MLYTFFLLIFLINNTICTYKKIPAVLDKSYEYAFICYPVVDLFGTSTKPPSYIPASSYNGTPCKRINQALFNETFRIKKIDSVQKTVAIIIPWAHYGYKKCGAAYNHYWVEEEKIIRLSEIKNQEHLMAIPYFNNKSDIATLILPFTDHRGITYSVGTQFVIKSKHAIDGFIQVKYFDSKNCCIRDYTIPTSHIFIPSAYSPKAARREFIKLIHNLISYIHNNYHHACVPYVWGGSSFTRPYTSKFIKDEHGFHRIEKEEPTIAGYDCSNLILRFARITGIPYFFKTTELLQQHGKKFLPDDTIEEGDLIWIRGHVAIISDIPQKLITECCGYETGSGKLQTIPLSQFLHGITSWEDLIYYYNEHKETIRIDTQGKYYKKSPIKIFKLI